MLERCGGIFTTVEIASEFGESDPIVGPESLVVAISQSGETADTLAAVRLARAMGAPTLAITNARGSQITREADAVLLTHAGHETSVAATKTFSSQVSALALLALRIGVERGTLDREQASTLCSELAERLADASFFVYLSRGVGVPVCLEGALKMREVTYIPTEAYAAGELKHGPIALIEPGTPVVCVAIDGPSYDKLLSNIQEVRARGAHVIAIATDGNEAIQHLLAKTVTVE